MVDHTQPSPTITLGPDELAELCARAIRAAGGSAEMAASLAAATVSAERRGKARLGVGHLGDFLDALEAGRIDGAAVPILDSPTPVAHRVDAGHGTAHLAFDTVFETLVDSANRFGIGLAAISHSYSAGELAWFVHRLAERGLVAWAGSNSPALMSLFGSTDAATGTNPLAFAVPHPDGPRLFDQASSATAWVNVREAADRGEAIPDDWAIDPQGEATTDAAAGLAGTLLPFGGVKGSNIAIMVELLATLGGGHFSLDAPSHADGDENPGIGLTIIAVDPEDLDPGYRERVAAHLERLRTEHGIDFGRKPLAEAVELSEDAVTELRRRGTASS